MHLFDPQQEWLRFALSVIRALWIRLILVTERREFDPAERQHTDTFRAKRIIAYACFQNEYRLTLCRKLFACLEIQHKKHIIY